MNNLEDISQNKEIYKVRIGWKNRALIAIAMLGMLLLAPPVTRAYDVFVDNMHIERIVAAERVETAAGEMETNHFIENTPIQTRHSTVRLIFGDGSGSGFIYYNEPVSENNNLLIIPTALHVVRNYKPGTPVTIWLSDENDGGRSIYNPITTRDMTCLSYAELNPTSEDASLDLAFCKVVLPTDVLAGFSLDTSPITNYKNEELLKVSGFPGSVDKTSRQINPGRTIPFTAEWTNLSVNNRILAGDGLAASGMSGGPMSNNDGEVVGLVVRLGRMHYIITGEPTRNFTVLFPPETNSMLQTWIKELTPRR